MSYSTPKYLHQKQHSQGSGRTKIIAALICRFWFVMNFTVGAFFEIAHAYFIIVDISVRWIISLANVKIKI